MLYVVIKEKSKLIRSLSKNSKSKSERKKLFYFGWVGISFISGGESPPFRPIPFPESNSVKLLFRISHERKIRNISLPRTCVRVCEIEFLADLLSNLLLLSQTQSTTQDWK